MTNAISCPKCGNTNVECVETPYHNHRCHDCGHSLLDAFKAMVGSAGETDPHYPEHVWVWADGNYFDAVVIHREWRHYQQASAAAWEADSDRKADQ